MWRHPGSSASIRCGMPNSDGIPMLSDPARAAAGRVGKLSLIVDLDHDRQNVAPRPSPVIAQQATTAAMSTASCGRGRAAVRSVDTGNVGIHRVMFIAVLHRRKLRCPSDAVQVAAAGQADTAKRERQTHLFHPSSAELTDTLPSRPMVPVTVVRDDRFITLITSPTPPRSRARPSVRIDNPDARKISDTV